MPVARFVSWGSNRSESTLEQTADSQIRTTCFGGSIGGLSPRNEGGLVIDLDNRRLSVDAKRG